MHPPCITLPTCACYMHIYIEGSAFLFYPGRPLNFPFSFNSYVLLINTSTLAISVLSLFCRAFQNRRFHTVHGSINSFTFGRWYFMPGFVNKLHRSPSRHSPLSFSFSFSVALLIFFRSALVKNWFWPIYSCIRVCICDTTHV